MPSKSLSKVRNDFSLFLRMKFHMQNFISYSFKHPTSLTLEWCNQLAATVRKVLINFLHCIQRSRNITYLSSATSSSSLPFLFTYRLPPRAYSTEKAMAPNSGTLAWRIPWTEETGRLQSMGSLRVGHDWATSLSHFTFMHWRRKWQPTPVFLPGESQGWGAWWATVYWGHTESDTTEVT